MKINESISVFVPAYNEEELIEENIIKINSYLENNFIDFELFIVDDSSKDNTTNIAKRIAKNKIKYLRFDDGPSRRENLAVAMTQAKNNIIVYMDLDLSTDLNYLSGLVNKIVIDNYDISIGSRYKGIKPKRKLDRLVLSKTYNTTLRILFGSKICDHQCGFKAFKKNVIFELIKDAGYDKEFKRGWFWDAEILIRAQKKKYKIFELPVTWLFGQKSSFKMKKEIKLIPYLLKLRLSM